MFCKLLSEGAVLPGGAGPVGGTEAGDLGGWGVAKTMFFLATPIFLLCFFTREDTWYTSKSAGGYPRNTMGQAGLPFWVGSTI